MEIQESGEDYLETILFLKQTKASVRSVDIVDERGFSKSSVSRAVNILKSRGLITIDAGGVISFTESGMERAVEISERHKLLTMYLIRIGVNKQVAEADACKIEHAISHETFEAIKNYVKKCDEEILAGGVNK